MTIREQMFKALDDEIKLARQKLDNLEDMRYKLSKCNVQELDAIVGLVWWYSRLGDSKNAK